MNLGKKILILIIILLSIPMISALFVSNHYSVKREIIINRSSSDVFNFIKYLKNQEQYSKWATMDPDMKRIYKGIDGTVGFIAGWDSLKPDVGKGEQEITQIEEGKRIDTELRFFEPFEGKDQSYLLTEAIDNKSTKVVWGFNGNMAYPMNLMLVFMDFPSMIGADFEVGLNNLKIILEK